MQHDRHKRSRLPIQVPRQVPGQVPGQVRLRERFVSLGGFGTKLTLNPRNYTVCCVENASGVGPETRSPWSLISLEHSPGIFLSLWWAIAWTNQRQNGVSSSPPLSETVRKKSGFL